MPWNYGLVFGAELSICMAEPLHRQRKKGSTGIEAPNIKVVGGKISNFFEAIQGSYKNTSITIGNITFENNRNEIALVGNSEKQLIIQDDFKGTASIYHMDRVEYPYIITMPGTSPEMRTRITYEDAEGNPHSSKL